MSPFSLFTRQVGARRISRSLGKRLNRFTLLSTQFLGHGDGNGHEQIACSTSALEPKRLTRHGSGRDPNLDDLTLSVGTFTLAPSAASGKSNWHFER